MSKDLQKIVAVEVDEVNLLIPNHEEEQERKVAIFDLLSDNFFRPVKSSEKFGLCGPFKIWITINGQMLILKIMQQNDTHLFDVILSLTTLRPILKDYKEICNSYYSAVKRLAPSQIETIDMGRRGIHDQGGQLLKERFEGKIDMDLETARRIFTLISVISN